MTEFARLAGAGWELLGLLGLPGLFSLPFSRALAYFVLFAYFARLCLFFGACCIYWLCWPLFLPISPPTLPPTLAAPSAANLPTPSAHSICPPHLPTPSAWPIRPNHQSKRSLGWGLSTPKQNFLNSTYSLLKLETTGKNNCYKIYPE